MPLDSATTWGETASDIQLGFFLIFSVVICELAFLAFVDFYRIHLEEAAIFRDEELLAREDNEPVDHNPGEGHLERLRLAQQEEIEAEVELIHLRQRAERSKNAVAIAAVDAFRAPFAIFSRSVR